MLSKAVWPNSDTPDHYIDRDNRYIKYYLTWILPLIKN